MEWKKVKTALIIVMLCVDLLLGFNIYARYQEKRNEELSSIEASLSLIDSKNTGITRKMALELPVSMYSYTLERNEEFEKTLAEKLLSGAVQQHDQGGDIYVYTGDSGTVRFARGGQINIDITGVSRDSLMNILAENSMDEYTENPDGTVIQKIDGYDILNGGITIAYADDRLTADGVWFFKGNLWAEETPGRAELLLFAAEQVPKIDEEAKVFGIQPGFFADNRGGKYTKITPFWVLSTTHGTAEINVMDKNPA